jgi:hypothetical protein
VNTDASPPSRTNIYSEYIDKLFQYYYSTAEKKTSIRVYCLRYSQAATIVTVVNNNKKEP